MTTTEKITIQDIRDVLEFYANNWKVYTNIDCWGILESEIMPNDLLSNDQGKKAKELLKLLAPKEDKIITYHI
jgi:hypothetical protein